MGDPAALIQLVSRAGFGTSASSTVDRATCISLSLQTFGLDYKMESSCCITHCGLIGDYHYQHVMTLPRRNERHRLQDALDQLMTSTTFMSGPCIGAFAKMLIFRIYSGSWRHHTPINFASAPEKNVFSVQPSLGDAIVGPTFATRVTYGVTHK